MKTRIFPIFAAAVLLAASCNKIEISEPTKQVFKAEISDEKTRTSLSDDMKKIIWSSDDRIGIFDEGVSIPVEAQIVSYQESSIYAEFQAQSEVTKPVYAFHPYSSSSAGLEQDGLWVTTAAATGSFTSANVMVAVPDQDNRLIFKNVVAIFRMEVNNANVRKLAVSAPGIAGKLHVAFGDGLAVTPDDKEEQNSIVIDVPAPGVFYIPVRPGTYDAGSLSITTYGANDAKIDEVTFAKKLTVNRNQLIDWSDPVHMNELYISDIQCDGQTAVYDAAKSTFTLTLPYTTDFSQTVLTFTTNGSVVKANGTAIVSGETAFDAGENKGSRDGEYKVKLSVEGKKEYLLIVRNTGLPVVTVVTPDGNAANKAITSKDIWVENITLKVVMPNGETLYETDSSKAKGEGQYCQMKGRGNTTWDWFDKKPYAIKLEKKAKLTDPKGKKGKRWILLANFKDRTLLRNDAAFWLSRQSGLAYTVRGMFVELVFNGEHRGNYYLCEQIRIDENRVNITEMEDNETGVANPINITGGFLIEADLHNDEGLNSLNSGDNFYYNIKSPDVDVTSSEARKYLDDFLKALKTSLSDKENHSYENYLDVDSAIDYFLLQELTSNDDFYNGGIHSTYMYKDRNTVDPDDPTKEIISKLFLGPIWDFDYSTFTPGRYNFWSSEEKQAFSYWNPWYNSSTDFVFYYKNLMKDKKFCDRLVERWNEYKDAYHQLPAYIDEMAEKIRLSEEYNHALWPQEGVQHGNENGEASYTFDDAVANIKNGFNKKWTWIDDNISKIYKE